MRNVLKYIQINFRSIFIMCVLSFIKTHNSSSAQFYKHSNKISNNSGKPCLEISLYIFVGDSSPFARHNDGRKRRHSSHGSSRDIRGENISYH